MSMTVKKLINELEKIENKFQEVKVICPDLKLVDIQWVRPTNMKFITIRTKEQND